MKNYFFSYAFINFKVCNVTNQHINQIFWKFRFIDKNIYRYKNIIFSMKIMYTLNYCIKFSLNFCILRLHVAFMAMIRHERFRISCRASYTSQGSRNILFSFACDICVCDFHFLLSLIEIRLSNRVIPIKDTRCSHNIYRTA